MIERAVTSKELKNQVRTSYLYTLINCKSSQAQFHNHTNHKLKKKI